MSFHSVPLSYKPKLDAVFSGACRQTIRLGRRYAVGDTVLFFEWTGRPRRSRWGRRITVKLTAVDKAILHPAGMAVLMGVAGWVTMPWDGCDGNTIATVAVADFIDPPTGEELKRVLEAFHGPFPVEGVEAQILRW